MPFDDILYRLSYKNLILYGAVIPGLGDGKKEDGKNGGDEEILWVDDPRNRQRAIEIIRQMV